MYFIKRVLLKFFSVLFLNSLKIIG